MLTRLTTVDLHDNQLTGELPAASWLPPAIAYLNLGNNGFSGGHGRGGGREGQGRGVGGFELRALNLVAWRTAWAAVCCACSCRGIPATPTQCHCLLAGKLPPSWVNNLKQLRLLSLSSNALSGELPSLSGLAATITDIWLGGNSLNGEQRRCLVHAIQRGRVCLIHCGREG